MGCSGLQDDSNAADTCVRLEGLMRRACWEMRRLGQRFMFAFDMQGSVDGGDVR